VVAADRIATGDDVFRSGEIMEALGRAGYRLTRARRAVAEAIGEQRGHFTAEQILSAAQSRHAAVARATVFRSLDLLDEVGLVERVDLPSGEHAWVGCGASRDHHHHLVCSRCGRSVGIGDVGIGQLLEGVALRSGYRIESHRLEVFGLCPACATRP
jgi:Fur family transcriptional regulator, ferric uptake regulator